MSIVLVSQARYGPFTNNNEHNFLDHFRRGIQIGVSCRLTR